MYGFNHSNDKMIINQNNYSLPSTQETFQAYADTIIPRSPELAEEYGEIQYFGALDLHTDEYLILSLNSYSIPLAEATAELLNIAAEQLIISDEANQLLNPPKLPEGAAFAALLPIHRFRALTLLQQNPGYFADLTVLFQNSPGPLSSIINILNRFTMMGYYSEWSGYGSTRLDPPDQRRLEYFPLSWEQVGYPGPSGYRTQRG